MKIRFRTMYDNATEFGGKVLEVVHDNLAPVVKGYTTRIRDLLIQYDGKLVDLLAAYNNGLFYQSEKKQYFIDSLNPAEVKQLQEYQAKSAELEKAKKDNDAAFEKFKVMLAMPELKDKFNSLFAPEPSQKE